MVRKFKHLVNRKTALKRQSPLVKSLLKSRPTTLESVNKFAAEHQVSVGYVRGLMREHGLTIERAKKIEPSGPEFEEREKIWAHLSTRYLDKVIQNGTRQYRLTPTEAEDWRTACILLPRASLMRWDPAKGSLKSYLISGWKFCLLRVLQQRSARPRYTRLKTEKTTEGGVDDIESFRRWMHHQANKAIDLDVVRAAVKRLEPKHQIVIQMRFGFAPYEREYTLGEIGKKLGVSHQAIQIRQETAFRRLKEMLQNKV